MLAGELRFVLGDHVEGVGGVGVPGTHGEVLTDDC